MVKILVTGATGFIGQELCKNLVASGFDVRGVLRPRGSVGLPAGCESVEVGDIGPQTDWQKALVGVDTVIHLAARVHVMGRETVRSLDAFRDVNVFGTKRLAKEAVKAGVQRFIFVSSVKVNGEGASRPYTEDDLPAPEDAYGISKREAEDVLAGIAAETGLATVILRLPLVYGPGVKANFRNLIRIASAGLPLPLKGINNRRSFLYLDNLVDAIVACATHPSASGQTFMISDGQDISTPDLISLIASAMNKKLVLFSLHPGILKAMCRMAGKSEELEKLTGSLLVDSSKIRDLLGWKPPFTLEEGIRETVKHYKT